MGSPARPPVEVIRGRAPDAVRGIELDFALLDSANGQAKSRVWSSGQPAVVLGVSRELEAEVVLKECDKRGVAVLRRASGGGTVVIGPGTVQYAFVLPHPAQTGQPSIEAVKHSCNHAVRDALADAGLTLDLDIDVSGDLRVGDRKVGGVALRRRRDISLLHGTLLVDADLAVVGALLHHPVREPTWRRGRSHAGFLANTGDFDLAEFEAALRRRTPSAC